MNCGFVGIFDGHNELIPGRGGFLPRNAKSPGEARAFRWMERQGLFVGERDADEEALAAALDL